MPRSNRFRSSLIAAAIFAVLSLPVVAVAAASEPRPVEVAAGDLVEAVETLARQFGINAIYRAEQLRGLQTDGVSGVLGSREAFEKLLEGTALHVTEEDGSVLISLPDDSAGAPDRAPGAARGDASTLDAVVVTASSRLGRLGFDAPTPTTVLSAEDLSIGGRPNVAAALNDLPYFRAGVSPQTTGTNTDAGSAPVDLRALGVNRTLVLIDGRRFSSTNDLNTIPTVLVRSVDIVTGGASAAWGSGAVSGVVNIAIDRTFTGTKLGAQYGVSDRGDANERRFEAALGKELFGGRGHVVLGAEFLDNDGLVPRSRRENVSGWATLPDGEGRFVLTHDVSIADAAYGGLILTGALAGQEFNPDGTLSDFQFGRVVGTSMVGGNGPRTDDFSPLMTPQRRYSAMGTAYFDLTDSTRLTLDVRHSRMYNDYPWFGDHNRGAGRLTIGADNAFLPAPVRDALVEAGESSFQMGRYNSDFAYARIDFQRKTTEATLAIDGDLGQDWRWKSYYTHGEYRQDMRNPGFLLRDNYARAVDSVLSPTTGQPVCRVALTDPTTDCVPINLFGSGSPSAAAIDYVTGTPSQDTLIKLDAGGLSLQGDPWALPAGDVSVALGIEARREWQQTTAGALDTVGAFRTFSHSSMSGAFRVKEAFGEILVPIVRDVPGFNKLEVNAAARISDYDTTGSIWSWKAGATNEFLPGFRARATRSRDIRSANLTELFTTALTGFNGVADPVTGQNVTALVIGGGNPDLTPEKADTTTFGLAWTPAFTEGLDISIDYFDITINDVIISLGVQEVVNRCFRGNQVLCGRITRDADNNIEMIRSTPVNLAEYKTDGIDAEVLYTFPAEKLVSSASGSFQWRTLATWVDDLTTDDGEVKLGYVGSQGSAFIGPGIPRLRVMNNIAYRGDRFGANLRARYISAGKYNRAVDIVNNDIGSYTYFDLGLNARIASFTGSDLEIYANINNLFDKAPPASSGFSAYYDVMGRYYAIGARLRF
ncbi:TonB-dependent receptor domain-containing protein [Luteimonas sp. R10]|uniref:TonB-dependent receptor domain-containing protein n=1 Tax=Luteimonas sp. R10 TaxID=3108176 RepID=UPI0030898205|nr:TonB-dependent receptor [Luteimonas sp. R10]